MASIVPASPRMFISLLATMYVNPNLMSTYCYMSVSSRNVPGKLKFCLPIPWQKKSIVSHHTIIIAYVFPTPITKSPAINAKLQAYGNVSEMCCDIQTEIEKTSYSFDPRLLWYYEIACITSAIAVPYNDDIYGQLTLNHILGSYHDNIPLF